MAEQETNADEAQEESGKKKSGLLIWIIVAVASIAGGVATPLLINQLGAETSAESPTGEEEPPALIEFGEIVVNLNESRLNRYLRVNIALLVNQSEELELTQQIEENKPILKSWLLSYLADKKMEDIRGATGQNRLRQEILNHFNVVLFRDGRQRIRNVLFGEFNIQ